VPGAQGQTEHPVGGPVRMFPEPFVGQVWSAGRDQKTAGQAARRVLGAFAEVQDRQSGYHARAAEVDAQ